MESRTEGRGVSRRGGARPGAGRPVRDPELGRVVSVKIGLPETLLDEINAEARATGLSRSQVIARRLRASAGS